MDIFKFIQILGEPTSPSVYPCVVNEQLAPDASVNLKFRYFKITLDLNYNRVNFKSILLFKIPKDII